MIMMKVRGGGTRGGPASRLPEKRPVIDIAAAVLSFLMLSVGFVAAVFLVLHWAAPSTN